MMSDRAMSAHGEQRIYGYMYLYYKLTQYTNNPMTSIYISSSFLQEKAVEATKQKEENRKKQKT
jgi:hypothetical protein